MRKPMSLRLRVTLLCAALLTLCCLLLTVTNNFSAIRMADAIQAVPLLPAQRAELEDSVSLPMAELHISDTIQQAQGAFHMQSLLAMVAILALGLFLIYRLVGKALAPLDTLTCRIRERTAADLAQPVEIPDSGDEAAAVALAFNQMSQRLNQVFVMQRNFSRNAAYRLPEQLCISGQGTGRGIHQNGDAPRFRLGGGLVRGAPDQLAGGEPLSAGCPLQIGQLQEFAHHGGQAVHLPLDDLEQLQCGLGAEVLLFAEQADSGL